MISYGSKVIAIRFKLTTGRAKTICPWSFDPGAYKIFVTNSSGCPELSGNWQMHLFSFHNLDDIKSTEHLSTLSHPLLQGWHFKMTIQKHLTIQKSLQNIDSSNIQCKHYMECILYSDMLFMICTGIHVYLVKLVQLLCQNVLFGRAKIVMYILIAQNRLNRLFTSLIMLKSILKLQIWCVKKPNGILQYLDEVN